VLRKFITENIYIEATFADPHYGKQSLFPSLEHPKITVEELPSPGSNYSSITKEMTCLMIPRRETVCGPSERPG